MNVVVQTTRASSWTAFWQRHGSAAVTVLCLLCISAAWSAGRTGWGSQLEIPLFLLAYVIGGYQKAKEGLETLFKEKDLDVDLLMVVAAIGAASIGYWMDGAVLIFIFSLSGTLEGYSMEKTNKDIESIMQLRPAEAILIQNGLERKVRVEDLMPGDLVLVKPGERIPTDGKIHEGHSTVNEASITGESIPTDKVIGDEVFAGTVNGQGALEIEVTKFAEDTLIARIIHLVQEAKNEMPPSQLFVERFEGIYAKVVVIGAILFMVLPPFLLGWTWGDTIYRAMIFLVVASPCALVSSIMPAILSGISNAARKGVLFKGGVHLENIGRIKAVTFDKTGTLTEGQPTLTNILSFSDFSAEELLKVAASLETLSEHPLAKAIVQYARDKGIDFEKASQVQAMPGLGVRGFVENRECVVGKIDLLQDRELTAEHLQQIELLKHQGKTVVYVEREGQFLGILAIQDALRPEAPKVVQTLRNMGLKVVILTGDNDATAAAIAQQAGIDEVFSELMPEQKVEIVKDLSRKYGKVAMIGDGVNDAPALATSAVGIAMGGGGTDVALETANVVLMTDDLTKIPFAITLGRRTTRVIKQNIGFAIAVILVLVVNNFIGRINLPTGVIGHEGSTLAVILSGLRLLR